MKKYIYTILTVTAIMFWYACTSPLEGITLKLPVALANSNVIVEFKPDNKDAGTLPKDLKITIAGIDSAKVVNSVGGKTFSVKQNILTLAAKPTETPSASSPIKFKVIAEAEGYLRSITSVEITSTTDQVVTVALTKISAPPVGVTVAQQPATVASSGTTSAAIAVTTPSTNGVAEKASINIPSGTTMSDENGKPVGGNINIVITKADATQTPVAVSLANVDKVLDKNNQPIPSFNIIPIVGMNIEMSNEQNQKVKKFSGQIDVQTELPAGAKDPSTGKILQEGDLIAIGSYDEDTRIFKYEGSVKLVKNAAGKLEAKGTINHLTSVFFASFGSITVSGNTNSAEDLAKAQAAFGATITSEQIASIPSYFISFGGAVAQYGNDRFEVIINDGILTFATTDRVNNKVVTPNTITKIEVRDINGSSIISVRNPFSLTNSVTLDLPVPSNVIELRANLKCKKAGESSNADNIHMYARVAGLSGDYFYIGKAIRNTEGLITASSTLLRRGGTYDFKFDVGGTLFYYDNQTVTNGSVHSIDSTMPDILCK
ncbi:hypothetical protein [Flectobacillus major]|uniref:hypothetical protein n=1 Tax=Flectobacillus major TaxID=103 RepID=UPI00047A747A|nr:hypothetical protein [Flectobacillus major]